MRHVDLQTLLNYLEPVEEEISKKSLTIQHLQKTLKGSKMLNVSLSEFFEDVYTPWANGQKTKSRPNPPSTPDALKKNPGTPTYTPPETPEIPQQIGRRRPSDYVHRPSQQIGGLRPPDFSEPDVRRPSQPIGGLRQPDFRDVRRPSQQIPQPPKSDPIPFDFNDRKSPLKPRQPVFPEDETPVIITGETSKSFKEKDVEDVIVEVQEEIPDTLKESTETQDAIVECLGLTGK